jgi:polysaccharide export outer membrane protein
MVDVRVFELLPFVRARVVATGVSRNIYFFRNGWVIFMAESNTRWMRRFITLSFLMLIGCRAQAQVSATQEPHAGAPAASSQATQPSSSASDPVVNYTIGPDDVLDIDVFGLPELSKTVRVSNDGTIILALIGRVQATGSTVEQLRKELESKYAKTYIRDPQVTVFVREFHSRPISVMGSVDKPGVYQITGNQTLIDMLSLAGGFSKTGPVAGRSVFVTRKGGFASVNMAEGMRLVSPEKVEINLDRLFYSRDQNLNIAVKPFDIVTVSQADIIYVMGGVRQPSGFPLPSKNQITVLQAVAMAGGLTSTASRGTARLIRTKDDGARAEIPIELGKIIKGQLPDVQLVANDILYINDSTTKAALRRSIDAIVQTTSGVLIYRSARP